MPSAVAGAAPLLVNYDEAKGVIANNAVHHDAGHPSSITLTVVPRTGG